MNEDCFLAVDMEAAAENYRRLQRALGCPVIAVIKSDGYGLGLTALGRALEQAGAGMLAVALPGEGAQLREAGIGLPILVMTPPAGREEAELTARWGLIGTVGCQTSALCLSRAAGERPLTVHMKLDTGFGRWGFPWDRAGEAARQLAALEGLSVEGIFTHCGVTRPRPVRAQRLRFDAGCREAEAVLGPLMRHFARSGQAGAPENRMDAVRIGTALVGRGPLARQLGLAEAAWLQARVLGTRENIPGGRPGYGGRWLGGRRLVLIAAGEREGVPPPPGGLHRRRSPVLWQGESLPVMAPAGQHLTLCAAGREGPEPGEWVHIAVNPLEVSAHTGRKCARSVIQ